MASVRFINCAEKTTFNNKLTAGEIASSDIVFIADEKMIWTHEIFYPCPYTKDEIDELIEAGEFTSATIGELVVSNQLTLEGEEKLGVPQPAVINVPTGSINFINGEGTNAILHADILGNANTATIAGSLSDEAKNDFVLVDGSNAMTGALIANGGVKLPNNVSIQAARTNGNYKRLIEIDSNDNILLGSNLSISDTDSNVTIESGVVLNIVVPNELLINGMSAATQNWVTAQNFVTRADLPTDHVQYLTDEEGTILGLDIVTDEGLGQYWFGIDNNNSGFGIDMESGFHVNSSTTNISVLDGTNSLTLESVGNHIIFSASNVGGGNSDVTITPELVGIYCGESSIEVSTIFDQVNISSESFTWDGFTLATQDWVTEQGYLTATDAANICLPLTGGTISGDLTVNNVLTVNTLQLSSLSSISANTTGKIYITAASNTTLIVDGDNEQLTFRGKDVATVDKLTAVSTITSENAELGKHIYTFSTINIPAIAGEYELLIPSESGLGFSTIVKDVNGEIVFNGEYLLNAQGYLKVWVSGTETYIIDDSKFKYTGIEVASL